MNHKWNSLEVKETVQFLEEVINSIIELVFSGLTAISENTTQRLNVAFNECTKKEFYRLGSSLRMLVRETVNFRESGLDGDFNQSLFAFLVSQTFLLCHGMIESLKKGETNKFSTFAGAISEPEPFDVITTKTLAIEKNVVKQGFVSFQFHLIPLIDDPRFSSVFKFSHVIPMTREPIDSDLMIRNPGILRKPPTSFINCKSVRLENFLVNFENRRIYLTKDSYFKCNSKNEDIFPQDFISKLQFHPGFLKKAIQRPLNPIDHEFTLTSDRFVKDCRIIKVDKEPQLNQESSTKSYWYGEIASQYNIPINIKLQQNSSNKKLIDNLNHLIELNKRIDYLYGKFYLKRCELLFHPLTIIMGNEFQFLTMLKVDSNNKAISTLKLS